MNAKSNPESGPHLLTTRFPSRNTGARIQNPSHRPRPKAQNSVLILRKPVRRRLRNATEPVAPNQEIQILASSKNHRSSRLMGTRKECPKNEGVPLTRSRAARRCSKSFALKDACRISPTKAVRVFHETRERWGPRIHMACCWFANRIGRCSECRGLNFPERCITRIAVVVIGGNGFSSMIGNVRFASTLEEAREGTGCRVEFMRFWHQIPSITRSLA